MGIGQSGPPGDGQESRSGKLRALAALSLFDRVSEPVLAELAQVAQSHSWPAGTLLFQRGDPSSYMIAMENGHIRISLRTRSGRELVLQHVRGSAIVGEIGLLDGSTRTADAMAVALTGGWVIGRRDYHELSARHPDLPQAAIRHLCGLVRYTTDHIESIALYGLKARLARFLLSLSAAPASAGADQLMLDLTQSEIADLIGSSRAKVSHALTALEREGAIARSGKSIRCDRDALVRIAAVSEGA